MLLCQLRHTWSWWVSHLGFPKRLQRPCLHSLHWHIMFTWFSESCRHWWHQQSAIAEPQSGACFAVGNFQQFYTQFSCSLQMLDTIAIICHWSFCWLRCSFSSSKSSTLRSFSTRFQYDEHDEIDSKKNEPLTVANKSLAPTMARSILVTFRIITVHLFAGGSCCKGREETPQESTSRGQPRNSGRPGFGIDGGLMGHDGTGIIAGYSRI